MKNILTQKEINNIDEVCKEYRIKNYNINSDGSIDVDGDINLGNKNLKELPLKFGKVSGYFNCSGNKLTTLEGCPESVSGNFNCFNNQLTSLKFSPSSVGGDFDCRHNQLTSLKFSPTTIGDYFRCANNLLPQHFRTLYKELSNEEIKIFFKYQDDLRIWEGEYNEEAAQDLYEEIKDGMR